MRHAARPASPLQDATTRTAATIAHRARTLHNRARPPRCSTFVPRMGNVFPSSLGASSFKNSMGLREPSPSSPVRGCLAARRDRPATPAEALVPARRTAFARWTAPALRLPQSATEEALGRSRVNPTLPRRAAEGPRGRSPRIHFGGPSTPNPSNRRHSRANASTNASRPSPNSDRPSPHGRPRALVVRSTGASPARRRGLSCTDSTRPFRRFGLLGRSPEHSLAARAALTKSPNADDPVINHAGPGNVVTNPLRGVSPCAL
jgi:hypothetical protein